MQDFLPVLQQLSQFRAMRLAGHVLSPPCMHSSLQSCQALPPQVGWQLQLTHSF